MRKVYFIIFAVVCLLSCITPVNALNIVITQGMQTTYNLGDISNNIEHVTISNAQILGTAQAIDNCYITNLNTNSQSFDVVLDITKHTASFKIGGYYMMPQVYASTITVNYNYQEPTPEPEGPYLTATVLSESTTGTMYEIQTHSTTATILTGYFSEITTTPQTYRPMFTGFEKERSITYKVPTGETVTFYSLYVNLPGTAEEAQQVSITVTGTGLTDEIINQTSPEIRPNNTAYNPPPIPTARPGTSDNPINSGKFKPSSSNFITPFTQFTENARELTRLPEMASPTELRQTIANTTAGNITAPLYDSIEGFSNLLIFPAVTISQNIQFILQPIEEMLLYCDDVLKEVFKTVNTFFNTIYPLRDFFYMLIPDFVWWIMATLLIFEIVVTLMTFIYGRSVTFYYLFGLREDKK